MTMLHSWRRTTAMVGLLALLAAACGGNAEDSAATDGSSSQASEPAASTTEAATSAEPAASGGSQDAAYCPDGDVTSSITVGMNNPNYATQLAVVLADESGYFADEGITDVEIIETDDYIAGLIGGSLDISQGDTDVLYGSAEASGEDLRYLGTYRNGEYQIMGVSADIKDPQDLVGQPVTGGDLDGRNTALMAKYLEALGVDPDSVQFVPMGGNSDARLQALIEGTVKAASLFPRHRVPLEEAGGRFIYNEFEVNPQEGVMAMGDVVDNDCATVVAFMAATLRARQDMYDFDNKDQILTTMRDRGFDIPDYFEAEYQVEVEQVSEDGGFDPAEMDDLVAEQQELGNLPEGIDWRQYVDLRPLHAAQEALGVELDPADLES